MGTAFKGLRGNYQTATSLSHQAAGPTKDLGFIVGGANATGNTNGTSTNSPEYYLPVGTAQAIADNWIMENDPLGIISKASTTDGLSSWYTDLVSTTGVTFTAGSTQAGYDGLIVDTTGSATSPYQNTHIAVAGGKPIANRVFGIMWRCFFPDPTTANYGAVVGFGNKQVAPQCTVSGSAVGTDFTDCAAIRFNSAASTGLVTLALHLRRSSGTATNTAIGTYQVAGGSPQSLMVALVHIGQTSTFAYARDPSLSTPQGGGLWTRVSESVTFPVATVDLRPHLTCYGVSGSNLAFNYESPTFWIEKAVNF